ncbi:hypothetical protein Pcinc_023660 [Petrolisthes cinctipes]|uniref:Uncharacterized protein n=1 Tax=Petrolisthes cinctipes TaxID=88211 RepID=A0AAE1FBD8_PETCI|nr:hypothetical protein Pcinc_023660 [Petrolisthes cinctipes]
MEKKYEALKEEVSAAKGNNKKKDDEEEITPLELKQNCQAIEKVLMNLAISSQKEKITKSSLREAVVTALSNSNPNGTLNEYQFSLRLSDGISSTHAELQGIRLVGHSHPTIWRVIQWIQADHAVVATQLLQESRGEPPKKRQKKGLQESVGTDEEPLPRPPGWS